MRNATAPNPPSFAALVQQFFTEHLVTQRAVSPRTVACYRDALMLFLDFASHQLGKTPTSLQLEGLDRHQRLIDSYKKLHLARAKVAA